MDVKGAQGEEKRCFCSIKPRKADRHGPFVPGSDVKRADREVTVAETDEKVLLLLSKSQVCFRYL